VNQLFYGDNLEVMRERILDEVADLVYLDLPFNSSRSDNLLFKQVKGEPWRAQIQASGELWRWSLLLPRRFKERKRQWRSLARCRE
jgi:hypothetical protein